MSSRSIDQILKDAKRLGKYDVGQTIEGLARKSGKKPSEILKLNSNENFFVPLDFLRNILREVVDETDPRIYPRDETMELREALGSSMRISPEEIVIGTGSDQLIDLVSRMILRLGDDALSIAPTFSIYERCVKIQSATYRSIPLKEDFALDKEKLLSSASERTRLLFLCSPNNPTANQFNRQDIEYLTKRFRGVISVDEAYVDFAEDPLTDLSRKYDNIVIFRTFSKVFGLAGLRLGYAIANRKLARTMDERYQMPYSVSLIALKAAIKILNKFDVIRTAINKLKIERGELIKRLNQIEGVNTFDSDTNFVLFQVEKNSEELARALLNKGVIIRNIGQVLYLKNCLRVTVAPPPLMDRFIEALKEVLGGRND